MNPLDRMLIYLVETDGKTEAEVDEEADRYMNIVFELCVYTNVRVISKG